MIPALFHLIVTLAFGMASLLSPDKAGLALYHTVPFPSRATLALLVLHQTLNFALSSLHHRTPGKGLVLIAPEQNKSLNLYSPSSMALSLLSSTPTDLLVLGVEPMCPAFLLMGLSISSIDHAQLIPSDLALDPILTDGSIAGTFEVFVTSQHYSSPPSSPSQVPIFAGGSTVGSLKVFVAGQHYRSLPPSPSQVSIFAGGSTLDSPKLLVTGQQYRSLPSSPSQVPIFAGGSTVDFPKLIVTGQHYRSLPSSPSQVPIFAGGSTVGSPKLFVASQHYRSPPPSHSQTLPITRDWMDFLKETWSRSTQVIMDKILLAIIVIASIFAVAMCVIWTIVLVLLTLLLLAAFVIGAICAIVVALVVSIAALALVTLSAALFFLIQCLTMTARFLWTTFKLLLKSNRKFREIQARMAAPPTVTVTSDSTA